jgi:hypothetical protein
LKSLGHAAGPSTFGLQRGRCFIANRLLDLAWTAWFLMAKDTAAKLCRTARRVVPEAEQYRH